MLGGVRNLSSLFEDVNVSCQRMYMTSSSSLVAVYRSEFKHSDAHWEIREALFAKIEKGGVSGMRERRGKGKDQLQ